MRGLRSTLGLGAPTRETAEELRRRLMRVARGIAAALPLVVCLAIAIDVPRVLAGVYLSACVAWIWARSFAVLERRARLLTPLTFGLAVAPVALALLPFPAALTVAALAASHGGFALTYLMGVTGEMCGAPTYESAARLLRRGGVWLALVATFPALPGIVMGRNLAIGLTLAMGPGLALFLAGTLVLRWRRAFVARVRRREVQGLRVVPVRHVPLGELDGVLPWSSEVAGDVLVADAEPSSYRDAGRARPIAFV